MLHSPNKARRWLLLPIQRRPDLMPLVVQPDAAETTTDRMGLKGLRQWVIWAGTGVLLVILSGYTLDHPVARYIHERLSAPRISRRVVHIPELLIVICILSTIILGAWSAFVGRLTGILRQLLLASISVCIAMTLTDALKIWFGRIPPMRWYDQQWRNFYAYLPGSFPSGHMTAIGAIVPFLWKQSRWLMIPLLIAGMAACYGLLMQQAHFVSDLIGGILVGGSVGYATLLADARGSS